MVPPLILLPLVENCVRHAVSASSATVKIRVSADREQDALILDVHCSAGAFPPTILSTGHGEGIGLANTRARLEAAFDGQAQMELENHDGGGTRVRLRLPGEQA